MGLHSLHREVAFGGYGGHFLHTVSSSAVDQREALPSLWASSWWGSVDLRLMVLNLAVPLSTTHTTQTFLRPYIPLPACHFSVISQPSTLATVLGFLVSQVMKWQGSHRRREAPTASFSADSFPVTAVSCAENRVGWKRCGGVVCTSWAATEVCGWPHCLLWFPAAWTVCSGTLSLIETFLYSVVGRE